jgi:hypothetical protein
MLNWWIWLRSQALADVRSNEIVVVGRSDARSAGAGGGGRRG